MPCRFIAGIDYTSYRTTVNRDFVSIILIAVVAILIFFAFLLSIWLAASRAETMNDER